MGASLVGLATTSALASTSGNFSGFAGVSSSNSLLATTATEAICQFPMPVAGVFRGMTSAYGLNSGTWSATFRKNATSGNQTISNSALTDTTHTDSVAANDLVDIQWGAGGGGPSQMQAIFTSTTDHWAIYCAYNPNGNATAAGATTFPRLAGAPGGITTESQAQLQAGQAGSLAGFAVYVSANAATSSSTSRTRKNTANANQNVTIGAGLTGLFRDTTNTDTIAQGDLFCGTVVNGGGGSLTITMIGTGFKSTTGNANDVQALGGVVGTATYARLYGLSIGSTESAQQIAHGFPLVMSRLAVGLSANAATGTSTVVSRINGVTGAQTASIGAGLTGWFTDTTHTDSVGPTDLVAALTTPGGTGSITLTFYSITEHAIGVVGAQAAGAQASSLLRGRKPQATSTRAASLLRGRSLKSNQDPIQTLQRQTNKQLAQNWGLTGTLLTNFYPNFFNMENAVYQAPYFYVMPHDSGTIAQFDPRSNQVIAYSDFSGQAGAGYFHGGVIFGNAIYMANYEHSGVFRPYIGRQDLSNFTPSGYTYVDVTAAGMTSTTESTGGGLIGPDNLIYVGEVDSATQKGIVMRYDPAHFDAAHVQFWDASGLAPTLDAVKSITIYDTDGTYVYGMAIVGPTERYLIRIDPNNFSAAGTLVGPEMTDKLGGGGFISGGYLWTGPFVNSDGTPVPLRQWNLTTLSVVNSWDVTPYVGQLFSAAAAGFDGRWGYFGCTQAVTLTNIFVVFDTQNPGTFDFLTPTNFDPTMAGASWSAGSPIPFGGGVALMTNFNSASGQVATFRQKNATDSFGVAAQASSLLRGRRLQSNQDPATLFARSLTVSRSAQAVAFGILNKATLAPLQATAAQASSLLRATLAPLQALASQASSLLRGRRLQSNQDPATLFARGVSGPDWNGIAFQFSQMTKTTSVPAPASAAQVASLAHPALKLAQALAAQASTMGHMGIAVALATAQTATSFIRSRVTSLPGIAVAFGLLVRQTNVPVPAAAAQTATAGRLENKVLQAQAAQSTSFQRNRLLQALGQTVTSFARGITGTEWQGVAFNFVQMSRQTLIPVQGAAAQAASLFRQGGKVAQASGAQASSLARQATKVAQALGQQAASIVRSAAPTRYANSAVQAILAKLPIPLRQATASQTSILQRQGNKPAQANAAQASSITARQALGRTLQALGASAASLVRATGHGAQATALAAAARAVSVGAKLQAMAVAAASFPVSQWHHAHARFAGIIRTARGIFTPRF